MPFLSPLSRQRNPSLQRAPPHARTHRHYGFAGQRWGRFHEDTRRFSSIASGALLTLKAKLELGDTVFLNSQKGSRQEQEVGFAYVDQLLRA